LVHLAGEEAEAAPIRIGRQTVRRRDVEVQAARRRAKSFCPRCHDLGDGEVAAAPEKRRWMPVKHPVAVPPAAMSLDVSPGTKLMVLLA